MAAIGHWEAFLRQTWHAFLSLSYMSNLAGQGFFEQGDGSVEERLCFFYNRIKHAEKTINGDFYPADATICMWLYNEGLEVIGEAGSMGI